MLTLSTHLLQREGGDKKKSMSRSKIFVAVAGVASVAACLGLTATVSFPSRTILSPVYTANTKPDLAWNGLPEKYQGNPVFEDMDHTDDHYTKDNKDPFGPKGQYGMWMNIQGDTINSFGCGPKGPMECFTGTTPGQHWANRETRGRMLPKMKVAQGTRLAGNAGWNGLVTPGIPFDENSDEKVTPDPFNMNGQYGYYMGIQVRNPNLSTMNPEPEPPTLVTCDIVRCLDPLLPIATKLDNLILLLFSNPNLFPPNPAAGRYEVSWCFVGLRTWRYTILWPSNPPNLKNPPNLLEPKPYPSFSPSLSLSPENPNPNLSVHNSLTLPTSVPTL